MTHADQATVMFYNSLLTSVNITVVKQTFTWLKVLSEPPIRHLASSTCCKGVPDGRKWQREGG